ncbi:MCE family protein, partial [bacterium]|nr:MCE family protein [bacterium]
METSYTTSAATRFKVGVFTLLGIIAAIFVSIFITNRPSWWRPCQYVKINVEDATGLNTKSPVRSLGIQVGYLKTVELFESHVALGVCLTAPVELLPSTRAYIRGEGFLGDRFVELKPLKYITEESVTPASTAPNEVVPAPQEE